LKAGLGSANCNICTGNNTKPVAVQNGFNIVRCRTCGLVYVNPRPSSKSLIELYNTYHSRDSKNPESWSCLMKENFMHATEILDNSFPDKGRLLDIGCAYGYFLDIMQKKGWDVAGIQPSENA